MTRLLVLLSVIVLSCGRAASNDPRVLAADELSESAHKRIEKWNVRSHAAGVDCDVLLIEAGVILDISMVERLHYGAERHAVVRGGIDRFQRDRGFRGVVYTDPSRRTWVYGELSGAEVRALKPCR